VRLSPCAKGGAGAKDDDAGGGRGRSPSHGSEAVGQGAPFCIVAYRGVISASEQISGTFKGFLVLDPTTGMYGAAEKKSFTPLQILDMMVGRCWLNQ